MRRSRRFHVLAAIALGLYGLVGRADAQTPAAPIPAAKRRGPDPIKLPRFEIEPIEKAQPMAGPVPILGGVYRLDGPVRFSGDGFFIAGHEATLDLNGHTVYYGEDGRDDTFGVRLYTNWLELDTNKINIPGAAKNAERARIINGVIVHAGRGGRCHAISGAEGHDVRIENVIVKVYGKDSCCVTFPYGRANVVGNVLEDEQNATDDRHMMPCNVRVAEGSIVMGNVIRGGNTAVVAGDFCSVDRNLIAQYAFATNGYGVATGNKHVNIRGNVIIPPVSGRGMIAGGGNEVRFEDNLVLAWNIPNEEFGWGLNACGVRVRTESRNYRVRYNTILAVGGKRHTSASGIYLTNLLADPASPNRFEFNDVTAILCGPRVETIKGEEVRRYAKAITFEGQGGKDESTPITDIIRNNAFRSNHLLVSTSGYDGGCNQGEPLVDNALGWTDGPHARERFVSLLQRRLQTLGMAEHPTVAAIVSEVLSGLDDLDDALLPEHQTFYSGEWGKREVITLLDTKVLKDTLAPVNLDIQGFETLLGLDSPRSLRLGDAPTVQLLAPDGTPIKVAHYRIVNPQGDEYYGVCDADGKTRLPIVRYALERPGVANVPFNRVERELPTIEVDGFDPTPITADAIAAGSLMLNAPSPPAQGGP